MFINGSVGFVARAFNGILKVLIGHYIFFTLILLILLRIYIYYDYGRIHFGTYICDEHSWPDVGYSGRDCNSAIGIFNKISEAKGKKPKVVYWHRSFHSRSTPWHGQYTGNVIVLKYSTWKNQRSIEELLKILNSPDDDLSSGPYTKFLKAHQDDPKKLILLEEKKIKTKSDRHIRYEVTRSTVWMRAKDFDPKLFYNPYGYPLALQYELFIKSTAYGSNILKPDYDFPVGYVVHQEIMDRFLNGLPKIYNPGQMTNFFARDYNYAMGSFTLPHYLVKQALASPDLLMQATEGSFNYFDPRSGVGVVVNNRIYANYGLLNAEKRDPDEAEYRQQLLERRIFIDKDHVFYIPFDSAGE